MVEYRATELSLAFAALANPSRRLILDHLRGGEQRVTDLAEPFPSSLNAISKHVKVLERAGLVRRRRRGREHFIALVPDPLRAAEAWIARYRAFWGTALRRSRCAPAGRAHGAGGRPVLSGARPNFGALTIRRGLPVEPAAVSRAWTDPARLARWMSPYGDAEAIVDPRPGGSLRIVMRGPGREIEHSGEFRLVEPPTRLVFTWQSEFTGEAPSLVTVTLRPHPEGTELKLVHQLLPADQVVPHTGGWQVLFEQLVRLLVSEPQADAADASPVRWESAEPTKGQIAAD